MHVNSYCFYEITSISILCFIVLLTPLNFVLMQNMRCIKEPSLCYEGEYFLILSKFVWTQNVNANEENSLSTKEGNLIDSTLVLLKENENKLMLIEN